MKVWNSPLNWADPRGFAGDGRKYYSIYYNDPVNWLFGGLEAPSTIPKGHSDFSGHDRFDWNKEDQGLTSPELLFISTPRHFRNPYNCIMDIWAAINVCDYDKFRRAMHQLQDYPFHYKKGYGPIFGHLIDGNAPDNDPDAWNWSEKITRRFIKEWDKKCECKNQ